MEQPKKIPHQSIICITIYYELCERQPDGKVSTKIKEKNTKSIAHTIRSSSLEECKQQTDTFLKQLTENIYDVKNKPT